MEIIVASGAMIGFFIFAILTVKVLFEAEKEELETKDKRYYYKKYLYHKKQAKKAYEKYKSL